MTRTIIEKFSCRILLLLAVCLFSSVLHAGYSQRPEVQKFIRDVSARHDIPEDELHLVLRPAKLQQSIIDAISRPAEGKPWHEYRPIFLTETRIKQGVEFWQQQQQLLAKIEATYKVPAEILVAIVGVETRYGRHQGKYLAVDALATLAFDYPPRAKFFKSELEHFLLLLRDEGLDPRQVFGSYAAAMGMPQFISSSYRSYAVDFDKDGQRNLWDSKADILGSVANYFKRHGWRKGGAVVEALPAKQGGYKRLLRKSLKPKLTSVQLSKAGLVVPKSAKGTERSGPYNVFELQGKKGAETWLGYQNFYVITRYNHSRLYAMAVWQLSQEIKQRYQLLNNKSVAKDAK